MTKTAKQILERVYNKGFNDRCQREKYADIDNQFIFALSVDQALKELEAIHQQEIAKARRSERLEVALDNYRGQTFSESTDYKSKFDKFVRNNERRIEQLTLEERKESN